MLASKLMHISKRGPCVKDMFLAEVVHFANLREYLIVSPFHEDWYMLGGLLHLSLLCSKIGLFMEKMV